MLININIMSPISKISSNFIKVVALIMFTLSGLDAFNQVITDASEKVNNLLTAHGKVNITRNSVVKVLRQWDSPGDRGGTRSDWKDKIVPITTQEYLQAIKIRTIKMTNLEFGKDSIISIPDKFIETSQDFVNLSSINSTHQVTLSLSFTRSTSISIAQTVTHTTTFGSNFSLKLGDVFTLGGSVQIGESETNGTTYITGEASTVTRSSTVSATVPPQSEVHVSFKQWTVRHIIKFKCMVVVDADVSPNDAGIRFLSQIADEKSRTFEINGTIVADDCSEGITTQSDPVKLTAQQLKTYQ